MGNNTSRSFKDKWDNNVDLAYKETLREGSEIQNWILNRNGWKNLIDFHDFLSSKKRILDAGCGNGRVTALIAENCDKDVSIIGVDLVSSKVASQNTKNFKNVVIKQKDLLENLSDIGSFDFIYSQEVLHHTDNPFKAFQNLVNNCLSYSGTIAIYVYKKKAVMREYCDDFIRDKISNMKYEDAINICNQITEFGKSLSEQKIIIKTPAVQMLGIEAGEYDLQRFIYHFFLKCFWSDNFNFNENSVINYDWYHPQNCERYDLDDIRKWFKDLDLEITHEYVDHYGITLHGLKKSK